MTKSELLNKKIEAKTRKIEAMTARLALLNEQLDLLRKKPVTVSSRKMAIADAVELRCAKARHRKTITD